MNELSRFFNSISFNDELFNEAKLEKVVLRKNENKFLVYIKNQKVIPVNSVNRLFLCAMNGINGEKKCEVELSYENITHEDVISYLNYFLDEIIIRRPSLISIKKSEVEVDNNKIFFHVLNDFEKSDLLHEAAGLVKELKRYGLGEYQIDISISDDMRKVIQEEIAEERSSVTVKKEDSPIIMGAHKDGNVTKLNNILGETKNIIVEIYIFNKEVVERQGKKGPIFILNLKVSDKTDSKI